MGNLGPIEGSKMVPRRADLRIVLGRLASRLFPARLHRGSEMLELGISVFWFTKCHGMLNTIKIEQT
jgi:hypothetical protein